MHCLWSLVSEVAQEDVLIYESQHQCTMSESECMTIARNANVKAVAIATLMALAGIA